MYASKYPPPDVALDAIAVSPIQFIEQRFQVVATGAGRVGKRCDRGAPVADQAIAPALGIGEYAFFASVVGA